MRKTLVIVPHPDDDVLSFGGYIITELSKGNKVRVIVMTCGGPNSKATFEQRQEEFISVMRFLGVTDYLIARPNFDGLLDTVPTSELTGFIDEQIAQYKPDNLLTCYPSTHGDHIALHKAFMAAIRLKDGYMPSLIAFGEYPFILPSLGEPEGGKMYLPMTDKVFTKKCEAFKLYKSQQKKSPSPLGVDGIRILSETRGLSCGFKYAEMYYIHSLRKRLYEI